MLYIVPVPQCSPLLDTPVPGAILMASGRISAKRGSTTWALVLAEGNSDSNPSRSNQCVSGPSLTTCLWKICGKMQSYGSPWVICSLPNDWGRGTYNMCSFETPQWFSFGIPMELPFALVTSLKDSTRMANVNADVLGWVQRKGPCLLFWISSWINVKHA